MTSLPEAYVTPPLEAVVDVDALKDEADVDVDTLPDVVDADVVKLSGEVEADMDENTTLFEVEEEENVREEMEDAWKSEAEPKALVLLEELT